MSRKADLDRELDRLETRLPKWARRGVQSLRAARFWLRLPAAIVLIAGGCLGFLPFLSVLMLPLGLAILALDLPLLRGPLVRMLAFINRKLAAI